MKLPLDGGTVKIEVPKSITFTQNNNSISTERTTERTNFQYESNYKEVLKLLGADKFDNVQTYETYVRLCQDPNFALLAPQEQQTFVLKELERVNAQTTDATKNSAEDESAVKNTTSDVKNTTQTSDVKNTTNKNNPILEDNTSNQVILRGDMLKNYNSSSFEEQNEIFATERAKNIFLFGNPENKHTIDDWNNLPPEEREQLIEIQRDAIFTHNSFKNVQIANLAGISINEYLKLDKNEQQNLKYQYYQTLQTHELTKAEKKELEIFEDQTNIINYIENKYKIKTEKTLSTGIEELAKKTNKTIDDLCNEYYNLTNNKQNKNYSETWSTICKVLPRVSGNPSNQAETKYHYNGPQEEDVKNAIKKYGKEKTKELFPTLNPEIIDMYEAKMNGNTIDYINRQIVNTLEKAYNGDTNLTIVENIIVSANVNDYNSNYINETNNQLYNKFSPSDMNYVLECFALQTKNASDSTWKDISTSHVKTNNDEIQKGVINRTNLVKDAKTQKEIIEKNEKHYTKETKKYAAKNIDKLHRENQIWALKLYTSGKDSQEILDTVIENETLSRLAVENQNAARDIVYEKGTEAQIDKMVEQLSAETTPQQVQEAELPRVFFETALKVQAVKAPQEPIIEGDISSEKLASLPAEERRAYFEKIFAKASLDEKIKLINKIPSGAQKRALFTMIAKFSKPLLKSMVDKGLGLEMLNSNLPLSATQVILKEMQKSENFKVKEQINELIKDNRFTDFLGDKIDSQINSKNAAYMSDPYYDQQPIKKKPYNPEQPLFLIS